jgi:hypothetical protein
VVLTVELDKSYFSYLRGPQRFRVQAQTLTEFVVTTTALVEQTHAGQT